MFTTNTYFPQVSQDSNNLAKETLREHLVYSAINNSLPDTLEDY